MIRDLYADVTIGAQSLDILEVEVQEGHKQTCSRCTITVEDTKDVTLNDEITIDMGFDNNHTTIFSGFVDEIVYTRLPGTYEISGRDVMKLATEHWLVSPNIENPWSRRNIQAENLISDLLSEAQIDAYASFDLDTSNYTFGVQGPAEFNLMSTWDAIRTICHILAYNCYAEDDVVYFSRVLPEPAEGKTSNAHEFTTGDSGNIILVDYGYNTDNLRNRVVVFGKDGIKAEAKTSSPYLPNTPSTFYKTAIVSSELIDQQSMADDAASYNLNLYNRLTEFMRIDAEGDPNIRVRDTVLVNESYTGNNDLWFVYAINHRLSAEEGYSMSMDLVK
jgi:hypothetical protein